MNKNNNNNTNNTNNNNNNDNDNNYKYIDGLMYLNLFKSIQSAAWLKALKH